jgi:hypothetical protein
MAVPLTLEWLRKDMLVDGVFLENRPLPLTEKLLI